MAIDAFLQFTDAGSAQKVEGESQDASFGQSLSPPCFELQNWDFGTTNAASISSATAGAGSGKATFNEFHIVKNIDNGTPHLFKTLCEGGHYPELTLWIRKAGVRQGGMTKDDWYLQWKFKMAFVKEINWSHADPAPTEDVKFVYGAIQFSYKKQAKGGSLEAPKIASWSQVLNNKEYSVPG